MASTGPFSTSRPRYMTTTSSAISAITPMSWVMRMMARPRSSWRRAHEVQDLGLGRHVERGRRLVGDQDPRLAGERHGDHDALAEPAGQLERVGVDPLLRARDADHAQQLDGPRSRAALLPRACCASRIASMHLVADGVEGRERAHRLLEDHGDLAAADRRGSRRRPAASLTRSTVSSRPSGSAAGAGSRRPRCGRAARRCAGSSGR